MFDLPVDKDRSHGDGALAGVGDLKTPKNGRGQTKFASSSANGAGTGFDIVIGNPPYVRQEQITHLKPTFEQLYVSFDGRADLFVYFYEAAVRLLKQGAVLAYISSNKWLRAKYGRALRGFLAGECAPRILIDFGELPVFSAATFPMVFVGVRGIHGTCTFVQVPSLTDPYPDVGRVVSKYGIPLTTEQLRSEIWTFTTGLESQVLDSIAKAPNRVPASQIMAGIKTGLNEAFWLDSPTRQELLRQDKAIGEFIKPLLVGDDIRRFRTKPVSKWIIYTPIGTDPKRLGPLKNHLVKWKARLERRALDQAWYELQQAQQRYCEYFEHPKIVYPDIAMEPRFTIDSSGRYLDMTAFAISSADKALLGVLNSQVAWFFLKRTAAVLGDADKRGRLRLKRQYIERLPLPDLHKEQSSPVANLVDALMFMNEYLSAYEGTSSVRIPLMMAYWDRVVNGLVYELYFREEIHAVGLRLFEIVNRSQIKELPAVPKASVLKYLAEKFEEIYDPEHPLRIALDKLQTLDLVRIIEGKS
jgi:hypothetical protein